VARLLDGDGTITYESDWDREYGLACGKTSPCKLLGPDDLCTIYRTRPNACVAFQVGDEQCQMARGSMGLAPLMPMPEVKPVTAEAP
jgi:Fe-S-cluster containining protein